MSEVYKEPIRVIESFVKSAFEVRSAFAFFVGICVIVTLLNFGLYWQSTPEDCNVSSGTKLCSKSLRVFLYLSQLIRDIFGLLVIAYFIAEGIRRYNFSVMALLPIVSFQIFISLFIWLFRDVFSVMKIVSLTPDSEASTILQRDFLLSAQSLDLSHIYDDDDFAKIVLVVVVGMLAA
jgi:hypothetical protein